MQSTLPKIIDLALDVEMYIPPDFCYSRRYQSECKKPTLRTLT